MKKSFFIAPILALALASCSSDEPAAGGNEGNVDTNYLSVSIVSAANMGRAVNDDSNYENGTPTENNVTSVRFYFFDENDNAANVHHTNSAVNYFDWTPESQGTTGEKPNVEKVLNATIIISTEDEDKVPTSVVAVVNPQNLPEGALSLSELNNVIEKFDNTSSFVMSNSVYANGSTKMEAVSVSGHLYSTKDAALANPVTIYVERVLAKVRMQTKLGDTNLLDPNPADATEKEEFNGKQIYVKFLGWNVTATANTSRLMKEINTAWTDADLFGNSEPWNYAVFFRSFWAINPTGLKYTYGPFNTANNSTAANAIQYFSAGTTDNPTKNYTYLQENAAKDNTGATTATPSQVIIAAQLVDDKGNAIEFAEWAFDRMAVSDLPKALANAATIYKENGTGADGQKKYTKVTANEIQLVTATTAGMANATTDGRYYVYANLTTAAANTTWYASTANGMTALSTDEANTALEALGGAKVWTKGYTYYFFNIRHLNPTEGGIGYYGVVRNHLYDASISSLKGLGTPVYDPDEIIIPEIPNDEDTFIAAELKVLSWRVVSQDIPLEW